MLKKLSLLLASLFCFVALAQAQKMTVKGKLTDAGGNPVSNVSITNKTTGAGTTSDANGQYSIAASSGDVLVFSSIGFETLTMKVGNNSELDLQLKTSAATLTEVVLVGTRSKGRVKTETTAPVDVLNVGQSMMPTARMDLTSVLNYAAPSFNFNKQSGSDGADHIDLATLRGLSPDQTLVLINGKRRHQTAFVAVFGTRGRGASGTDLNAIPFSAIDRVEILRDGASAQYGSDAIAGVINLVLKKNINKFTGSVGLSAYYDPTYNPVFEKQQNQFVNEGRKFDGRTWNFNGNYGFALGKHGGFANVSFDVTTAEKTFRQVLDTSNQSTNVESLPFNYVRRAHGDASVTSGGIFVNGEIPIAGTKTVLYANGGWNHKNPDAYAFTRQFSGRPDRFPTDPNGDLIEYPGIIFTTEDGEKYFNPRINTRITDASLTAGVRGVSHADWNWDLSYSVGHNRFHFFGEKTFNASFGAGQTNFDDGGFTNTQNTFNINGSKQADWLAGFNFGIGAEFRYERYTIFAGETASYRNYDPTGNKATGAQGFPGYQPGDEVKADRRVWGLYVDGELDITKQFLVNAAIRIEDYSDFGNTLNFKLASRYKVNDRMNIRGSVSTGFRAPSLQQINFSSTFTTVQGGTISEVKIAPNYSSITRAAGIPNLKQEEAFNASLGFTFKANNELNITIDGYLAKVKDRVVLSGQFSAGDPALDAGLKAELNRLKVGSAQFFANAVNTTNTGVDIVVEYNKKLAGEKSIRALLTGNIQSMTIDQINVPAKLKTAQSLIDGFYSDREQQFLLASAPPVKFGLTAEYNHNKKLNGGIRLTYFGKITTLGYGEDGLGVDPQVPTDADPTKYVPDQYDYPAKITTDLFASYKFFPEFTLFAGVDNVFNVHPAIAVQQAAKGWAFNNETGGPWDAVQMGGNGRRFFLRAALSF